MSLERGFDWQYENHLFKGYSLAGQSTSIYYKNPKICFDIGQGLPFHLSAKLFCLSHLHADHGSGINYLISQRSLFQLPSAKIMLPWDNIEPVEIILEQWQKIEDFDYSYKLIPSRHGETFRLDDKFSIMPFQTTHRVNSYGYLVYENKKKLKPEFENKSRFEIMEAKKNNIEIEMKVQEPLVAFTGDTQIEFLDSHPDVLKAKVLFVECTYIDDKKTIENTRQWGHTHLDEIIKNYEKFENEHISLIHLSSRYSTTYAQQIIKEKLPPELSQKTSIFPRPL